MAVLEPDISDALRGPSLRDRWLQFWVLVRLKTASFRRGFITGLPFPKQEEEAGKEKTNALLLSAIGLFVGYIGHDAFQEEVFRSDGFKFGWFMTLAEVTVMIAGALISEGASISCPPGGMRTALMIAIVGICIASSHGFGNTALQYSPYPLKVAFKSCKLVPTMALGGCLTGRRHSPVEYVAGFVMCVGLFVLSMAETVGKHGATEEITTVYIGPILLLLSTSLDSIVPNLQEKLLQQSQVRTVDMVFLSNLCVFVILACYTLGSGELQSAALYCKENPLVLKVLALQGGCAYFGLRCYLAVIREHGGVAGVLLTNARKIVTIVLSFLLFSKPCNSLHLAGLLLVFIGVYIGVVSKQAYRKGTKQPDKDVDEEQNSHEHVV